MLDIPGELIRTKNGRLLASQTDERGPPHQSRQDPIGSCRSNYLASGSSIFKQYASAISFQSNVSVQGSSYLRRADEYA